MSSDSELEPTPPKRRRHSQHMSGSDDSGRPAVAILRSERINKHEDDNDDVFVLSDIENDPSPPRGSESSGVNSNSGSPSTAALPLDLSKTSKRSSEAVKKVAKEEAAGSSTGIESDSNELEAEKCPICWLPFTNQEVANPSTCDHRFCFHCIMEWSKTTNTCPVDRQTFNDINVRPKFGGKVTRLVPVATRVTTDTDMEAEDAEPDSDPNGHYDPSEDEMDRLGSENESSVELATTFSTEDVEDDDSHGFEFEYSSSNDNYVNPVVVVVSSSDEDEVQLSSPSEYNELSPSSSPNPPEYFSRESSSSSCSTPSLPRSPTVSLSPSPSSPSPSPSLSPSRSSSPSPSPSLLSSNSRSLSPSLLSSHSPSISQSLSPSLSSSHSHSPSTLSLSPSFERSPSCCSLSNASSVSFSSSS